MTKLEAVKKETAESKLQQYQTMSLDELRAEVVAKVRERLGNPFTINAVVHGEESKVVLPFDDRAIAIWIQGNFEGTLLENKASTDDIKGIYRDSLTGRKFGSEGLIDMVETGIREHMEDEVPRAIEDGALGQLNATVH